MNCGNPISRINKEIIYRIKRLTLLLMVLCRLPHDLGRFLGPLFAMQPEPGGPSRSCPSTQEGGQEMSRFAPWPGEERSQNVGGAMSARDH